MRRILVCASCLLGCANVFAEQLWTGITSTDESRFEIQDGSFEFKVTKGGTPVGIVVGRVVGKSDKKVDLHKWYVSATECTKRKGKLNVLTLEGKFEFDSEFAIGDGTVAALIAGAICKEAQARIDKTNLDKGI